MVIAAYLPPNYKRQQGEDAVSFLTDLIAMVKNKYRDPYVMVWGDFNQWEAMDTMSDFADMREIEVGSTSGEKEIDRFFGNVYRSVTETGTLAPLETEEDGRRSDHRVAFFTCELPRKESFVWQSYS